MLGSPIFDPKDVRIVMFQLSGFYLGAFIIRVRFREIHFGIVVWRHSCLE